MVRRPALWSAAIILPLLLVLGVAAISLDIEVYVIRILIYLAIPAILFAFYRRIDWRLRRLREA